MLAVVATILAALLAWVAYFERENRREFQRMMKEHNIQVREMNGHYRPLENDFVHLEERVDELAKDLHEMRQAVERIFNTYREPTDERPYDHL